VELLVTSLGLTSRRSVLECLVSSDDCKRFLLLHSPEIFDVDIVHELRFYKESAGCPLCFATSL
jgi:hypothetical protein